MGLLDPGKELKLKHGAFGMPENGVVVKLKIVEGGKGTVVPGRMNFFALGYEGWFIVTVEASRQRELAKVVLYCEIKIENDLTFVAYLYGVDTQAHPLIREMLRELKEFSLPATQPVGRGDTRGQISLWMWPRLCCKTRTCTHRGRAWGAPICTQGDQPETVGASIWTLKIQDQENEDQQAVWDEEHALVCFSA
ncbi:predicted protein [Histoplasma capsulatum var. duboisii H88]|uniref:Predicted protein n=1 Tax=Ajellomyces capsulatus (strain H88) TaxID=544711 RepID=F0UFR8_AJEC8|nr:predicted protein [Histoplasma capsulatum var. duboisii H88]